MRIHELAKELGITSKDMLAAVRDLGVEAKSHMSKLEDDDVIALLREKHRPAKPTPEPADGKPEPKPEPKPAPKPEPEPKPVPKPAETKPAHGSGEVKRSAVLGKDNTIQVGSHVIVKDLAEAMAIRPNLLIAELMSMNVLASINQRVEISVAQKVAEKHGFHLEQFKKGAERAPVTDKVQTGQDETEDRPEDLITRAPVVTFLGHVDHGKTSLLDGIRNANVAASESGGITQHIGAYSIDANGHKITFLDTPGHAAFTAMRARGANLTDIAVIIIAADDGIMPQTQEAIQHARAAEVSIMVAINKCDLPTANPTRVMQQLQGIGLAPEEWGGETVCVQVSAVTGAGMDHLLEMILLQAELLELKANPERSASGYVIEAQMEPGMGPTASLLVTRGTLKLGDAVICGQYSGNVRALINDQGAKLKSAGPSTPIKCLGLSGVPEAGAEFNVCKNDRVARAMAQVEQQRVKSQQMAPTKKASLDSLFDQLAKDEQVELNAIVKADTQGSIEAIRHALQEIKSDKVSIRFILTGTGNITVNDVMLASASNAIILGFHIAKEPGVESTAKHESVEIRLHSIIYELIDQVRDAMTGLLAPEVHEKVSGHARVLQLFSMGKSGTIAGCLVTDGTINPALKVRVIRKDEVLYEGSMVSLKHFQDEVREVRESQECGIRLNRDIEYSEGDILECYELQHLKQSL